MRRDTSSTGLSVNGCGARRWALSMVSWTSAWLRGGRLAAPAKITSSMPWPRMALAELAPITQRRLSRTLDLPQPLGPTMPVRPGSMWNSVGSTKDLKPTSLRRWNCTRGASSAPGHGGAHGDFQPAERAVVHQPAVDEEAGRVVRPRRVGAVDVAVDRGAGFRRGDAGLDLRPGAPARSDGRGVPVLPIAAAQHRRLPFHQDGGHLEEPLRRGAARQRRRR